jgi:casein kinase II subunit beta
MSNSDSSAVSWIVWCCSLPGHDWLLQVPEAFIEDDFNLISLSVPNYASALDMILDLESDQVEDVEADAITLYGLIHARFLTTRAGLASFRDRFQNLEFGNCPRVGMIYSPLLLIQINAILS